MDFSSPVLQVAIPVSLNDILDLVNRIGEKKALAVIKEYLVKNPAAADSLKLWLQNYNGDPEPIES